MAMDPGDPMWFECVVIDVCPVPEINPCPSTAECSVAQVSSRELNMHEHTYMHTYMHTYIWKFMNTHACRHKYIHTNVHTYVAWLNEH